MTKDLYAQINQLKKKLEGTVILHNFDFQHAEVLELSRKLDQLIVKTTRINLNKKITNVNI